MSKLLIIIVYVWNILGSHHNTIQRCLNVLIQNSIESLHQHYAVMSHKTKVNRNFPSPEKLFFHQGPPLGHTYTASIPLLACPFRCYSVLATLEDSETHSSFTYTSLLIRSYHVGTGRFDRFGRPP